MAAHAHRTAAGSGKQDHLTGHELSQQAMEYSRKAQMQTEEAAWKIE